MLRNAALTIVGLLLMCAAAAQAPFPGRTVTMVVGFAPGGGTDIASRIIAKLPYNPLLDLAPITMAVVFPNVLVVHASVAAQTLADLVKLAQAKPGGIHYGSSGIGGAGHLAGELFRMMAKVDIVHVPYKGGGPAVADLLGGRIAAVFATPASAGPHIKSGKIRALAVTGAARSTWLPEVPTIAESGYPGYEATNWYAYVAPAATPKPIVDRLNHELVEVLSFAEIREQLLGHGLEPAPGTSEALARHIEREWGTWGRVMREAGITVN